MKKQICIIFIFFVGITHAQEVLPLKVEVHCGEKIKNMKLKELCQLDKSRPCSWKNIRSSKTASSWDKDGGRLQVVEVPNEKLVRIIFNKGPITLAMPWCAKISKVGLNSLKPIEIETLRKKGEVVYILRKENSGRWNMLNQIDHPCRKLQSTPLKNGFHIVYLRPVNKKGCQTKPL
jgi:hypothetical protein